MWPTTGRVVVVVVVEACSHHWDKEVSILRILLFNIFPQNNHLNVFRWSWFQWPLFFISGFHMSHVPFLKWFRTNYPKERNFAGKKFSCNSQNYILRIGKFPIKTIRKRWERNDQFWRVSYERKFLAAKISPVKPIRYTFYL